MNDSIMSGYPFNRTRLGLKQAKYEKDLQAIQPFNRTRLGLKQKAQSGDKMMQAAFNRTRLGLKQQTSLSLLRLQDYIQPH